MNDTIEFLIQHGGFVLFAAMLVEGFGLPIPAIPWLLAAGALVRTNQLSPTLALGGAMLACLIADSAWFALGFYGGNRVLRFLCRISLEPDSCVRRTRNIFERHGMRAVLFAKFLPGLNAVVPPMAGSSGIGYFRYLVFDAIGSVLYAGSYLLMGALLSNQLETVINVLAALGKSALALIVTPLLVYILLKVYQRRRLVRELRVARITVGELRKKQEAGNPLAIVDLRSNQELERDPFIIPGAVHFNADEIENRPALIPLDREVVLYCSCPNEATSASVACFLRRHGIAHVRPLLGSIDAWRRAQYPMEQWHSSERQTPVIGRK